MAKIDVYTNEMSSLSARLKKISSVIENAEQVTGKVQSNLDIQVAAKADIAGALSRTRKQLRQQKDKVVKMADLTTASAAEFRNADGQMDKNARNILGKIVAPLTNVVRGVKQLFVGAAISRYKSINSLFMPAGTIITVAGISELIRRLAQIINGWKENGNSTSAASGVISGAASGSTGASGQATAQEPQMKEEEENKIESPAPKPEVVNTGSSAKNAANAGITYYTQGKNYNKYWEGNAWKGTNDESYAAKASVACGICCEAMIASYFGAQLTPGQLLQANGGSASWDGKGVTALMKNNGITSSRAVSKTASPEEKMSKLDDCIERYKNDPEHCAPPMVSIYSKGADSNHFVMVVGKDANGDYIIIDPANDERTTLKALTEATGKGNKTGYASAIKGVWTWTKG